MEPSLLGRIIDFIFPRSCVACGKRLSVGEDLLCGPCNFHLARTNLVKDPYSNFMAQLFWKLLPVERCAALFYYKDGGLQNNIVHGLKYHSRSDYGIKMGKTAATEFAPYDFFDGVDVIVPVPIARNRERERGYNQSVMIARGVSAATGIPVCEYAFVRDEFVSSQTSLNLVGRWNNVKGTFHLIKPDAIAGKHVLIVDDVCTTGATLRALGEEAVKAGGVRISFMTLAVVKH